MFMALRTLWLDTIFVRRTFVLSRREKLIGKMRRSSTNIRFGEVKALLRYEGFVLFNKRGSHYTYHRPDGRLLTVVRPHGKRKTCHTEDIRKILEALEG
jgi:predicted RNA binding protein YcfA (HicA-like mRNA interferase family)